MSSSNQGKAVKAGIGYTIGNVLSKGLTFLSIPLFARVLTVADYGIYNTFASYVSILSVVIGFALHTSIKNAKIDHNADLAKYNSSVLLLAIGNAVVLLVAGTLFMRPLANLLSLEKDYFVLLIVLESFGVFLLSFYNCVLAVDYRYREYMIITLAYAVCGIVISLGMIYGFFASERYLGRIAGAVISACLVGIVVLIQVLRKARPKMDKVFWRYGLKISLPIVPHGLSQILLAQFDRIMIKKTISEVTAGLYSFAYNVGIIYQVVANSLDVAWTQWFFERMKAKSYEEIRKVGRIYSLILTAGAIILMLAAPELSRIMGGDKYIDSIRVSFPIVLAMFYSAEYNFPAAVEYYYKKTKLIAIATTAAAVLNIILNLIFIPRYGYVAAAYTTVVCYLAYLLIHVLFSYKIHGSMIYDIKTHGIHVLIVTCANFALIYMEHMIWIRWGILVVLLAVAGFFVYRNKNTLRTLLKKN